MQTSSAVPNVVLVHGGFVDGSGWQAVYDLLKADGFKVSVVQTKPFRLRETWPRRSRSSTLKAGQWCWSVTRMAAP